MQPPHRARGPRQAAFAVAAFVAGVLALALALAGRNEGGSNAAATGGLTGPDFHSLVVDPADPSRIFVGGHQAVSVSLDGGRTWTEVATLRGADAMGWGFDGETVYVSGHPGLNRSTDGGRTFQRVNDGLPDTDVHAFGASVGTRYGASPAVGVFGGDVGNWQIRTVDAGRSFFGRIVIDPADHDHLFAADAGAGVVESSDGGRSWRRLGSGLPIAAWLSATADLSTLVASGPRGAARSTDGGRTWQPLQLPDGTSLVEVASDGSVLYAGRHRGERVTLLVSRDGGATWKAP